MGMYCEQPNPVFCCRAGQVPTDPTIRVMTTPLRSDRFPHTDARAGHLTRPCAAALARTREGAHVWYTT